MTNIEKHDLSNDMIVKGLKCIAGRDSTEYFDLKIKGFCIRVGKGGKKTWYLKYTTPGTTKQVRHHLGVYPGKSCADARAEAQGLRIQVDNDEDPAEKARAAVEYAALEAVTRQTFNQVYKDYCELRLEKRKLKSEKRIKARLAVVLKTIGEMKCSDFKKAHYKLVMDPILRHSGYTANKTHIDWSVFMDYAVQRDALEYNVLDQFPPPFDGEKVGDRSLEPKEIGPLWHAMPELFKKERHAANIVKLLLVTGQRSSEIRTIQLSWIDWEKKELTIPETKTGKEPHVVPLSDLALEILEEAKKSAYGDVLFSLKRSSKPISHSRVTNLVFNAQAAFMAAGMSAPWSCHDLRRTFVTLANENNPEWELYIEHVVNHRSTTKKGTGRKHYNKYKYIKERRMVLDKWATFLQGQIDPQGSSKVVPFRTAA